MAVLDRYYAEIIAKPSVFAPIDFSLFGYFDSKEELAQILTLIAKRVVRATDLHVRILDAKDSSIVDDAHFNMSSKKRGNNAEAVDARSHKEIMGFINKYFSLSDHRPHTQRRYLGEFLISRDGLKDSVILAYFSAPNEFVPILMHVGKRVDAEGQLSLTIDCKNHTSQRLCSKSFRTFPDSSILVPDLEPHYIHLKNENEAQGFALFLWESDL